MNRLKQQKFGKKVTQRYGRFRSGQNLFDYRKNNKLIDKLIVNEKMREKNIRKFLEVNVLVNKSNNATSALIFLRKFLTKTVRGVLSSNVTERVKG